MNTKHFLTVSAIALGLMSAPALAQEEGKKRCDHPKHSMHNHGHHGHHFSPERVEKHLEKLKAELKLSKKQEEAWQRYAEFQRNAAKEFGKKSYDHKEFEQLSKPERMEKGLEKGREYHKKLEQNIEETKRFYNVLTTEQKKIFDKPHHPYHGKKH